jgi:hypothetical protein
MISSPTFLNRSISVSFRVVTPGGGGARGVSGGADTKRRCKIFLNTNFLLFPASHSSLPSSTSSLPAAHANANSPTAGRFCMIGSRATPQKIFLVKFSPGGPTLRPGGGWAPPGECLNVVMKISGKFPERFRKVSGNFRKISGKFPENFR